MKKNSLVAKLLFTFTLIIGITFIIIASVLSAWFEDYYFEQRKGEFDIQANIIEKAVGEQIYRNPRQYTSSDLNSILSIVSNSIQSDILLTDSYGYIYRVTNPAHSNLIPKKLDIKNMEELKLGNAIEEKTTENKMFSGNQYIYYKPVMYNNIFRGVIVMITPMEKVKEPLKKVYSIIWTTAIIALAGSTFIIYYFCQRILIAPLASINLAAKRLAKGEIGNRVVINSNDEIGELANSFNVMADSIEEVEQNRREFISNVSHEIRSPITSIKGFIAGILDGVIPKDKENYYLEIAYNEIQRLTRLVNDLLDLSTMQAGKLKLDFTEIDINGIIKNCVISTEQKIKEKKINAEVVLENQHLFVIGDRDRLIQVMTNLVDNAIKYCSEGGNIKVTSRAKGNKVWIDVFNTGSAISEDEKKYIWDRFYKSDKSRTNKVSTGLGLPIVRQILTQHGEDIWVENKSKDSGVVFTFTLKRSL
ncbi:Signal transduction histidine kinase [Clostridium cavendishii DSM 21758]|uniref:histidine kinase n=1 Tax=Clostridium cavendishii DSM 21758 TaxID=1121302 RepID=A0A1M6P9N9_9CLOT|nr:HAMP domain-containing sensor histidine kinase [Clostridium cavendishii]SHK04634.1 Signal transduction histidine kinase [Clostridium cavendishii DSM 21758]